MKIVHICLCGPFTDNFNYQENNITKYHKKMGLDVTVITSKWIWESNGKIAQSSKTEYIDDNGNKIIRIPILYGTVDSRMKVYPQLIKKLTVEKPDILFIHDCQFLDIVRLSKYAKKNPNVTVYVDNHVDYSNGAHGWLSKNILHKGLWRICTKRIESYVKKFYGVLPARVDFLTDIYGIPKEKCELLVMGADDKLVDKATKEKNKELVRYRHAIGGDDFLIVTGGKIDAFKTQTILLMEAVKNIKNEKLKLIVFGSVSDELIDKVKELSDEKKVQYIGWIDANKSYDYFAAADLVVFPGRHSVFWEQVVALGVPMIVKDWAGTHHIDLGGNVRYLYNDSEEEIKKILEELLNDENAFNKMKISANKHEKHEFMYSRIAERSIERVDI